MTAPDKRFGTLRDLQLRVEQLEQVSSGSGGNGSVEVRVAKLESDVENIKVNVADIKVDIRGLRDKIDRHFLITWGGLFFVALGLAGLMAKGFKWL